MWHCNLSKTSSNLQSSARTVMWAINTWVAVYHSHALKIIRIYPDDLKTQIQCIANKKISKPSHNITCFRQTVLNQMHDKIKEYKSTFNLTDDKGAPCHQKRLWYNTTLSLEVNCITYNTLPKIRKMLSSSYNMKRFVTYTYQLQNKSHI